MTEDSLPGTKPERNRCERCGAIGGPNVVVVNHYHIGGVGYVERTECYGADCDDRQAVAA